MRCTFPATPSGRSRSSNFNYGAGRARNILKPPQLAEARRQAKVIAISAHRGGGEPRPPPTFLLYALHVFWHGSRFVPPAVSALAVRCAGYSPTSSPRRLRW